MSKKATIDALRQEWVTKFVEMLTAADEEVLRVGSNELAIPVVDGEGEEQYIVLKVQVPLGSRDGEAYDAYGLAQEYEMKLVEKAEKKAKADEAKARKIARDAEMRKQKADAKARAAAEKEERD